MKHSNRLNKLQKALDEVGVVDLPLTWWEPGMELSEEFLEQERRYIESCQRRGEVPAPTRVGWFAPGGSDEV